MFVVRNTFTAKPGQAGKLAKLFKKMMAAESNVRVMTDYVAGFNTVEMEMTVGSLAEWEQRMTDYMTGKVQMDAATQEEMKAYTELWHTGKREVFQVTE